jgi:hypothetical protein
MKPEQIKTLDLASTSYTQVMHLCSDRRCWLHMQILSVPPCDWYDCAYFTASCRSLAPVPSPSTVILCFPVRLSSPSQAREAAHNSQVFMQSDEGKQWAATGMIPTPFKALLLLFGWAEEWNDSREVTTEAEEETGKAKEGALAEEKKRRWEQMTIGRRQTRGMTLLASSPHASCRYEFAVK